MSGGSSNGNLIIYVQENATTTQGTPFIDFSGFVARRNGAFVLDFTRTPNRKIGTPPETTLPATKLLFQNLWQVKEFLNSVLGADRGHMANKVSLETHVVQEYGPFTTFYDLWESTGKHTEVAAFDDVSPRHLVKHLSQLENVDKVQFLEDERDDRHW